MIIHILTLLVKSILVFLVGIPVTLLGLITVPIGYLFRHEYRETTVPFTQYPGNWMLVRMPRWLLPWDNQYDGMMGDKRGWWDNWCKENYKKDSTSFKAIYMWTAIRNPANYWSRNLTGLDLAGCKITKLAGNVDEVTEEPGCKEWLFLLCTTANGSKYHRFFMSWAYDKDPTHGIMIDIGWKFKLKHNEMPETAIDKDRIRGSVFTLSPWKKLT